jgi:hypothetical protein
MTFAERNFKSGPYTAGGGGGGGGNCPPRENYIYVF